jgi:5'-3' exonuclease
MNLAQHEDKQSLLIIDSFALLFRGFFSMAVMGNYMRNSQGLCTNGLYQFTRYMMDAIRTFNPTHVVCTFDMGKETFRNQMYPLYKANRDAPPEELIPQFDKLWELVEAFDIPCVGKVGYEADDMIGSMAKYYSAEGIKVNILTGDGDTLQLINEFTEVSLMKKGFGNYETVNLANLYEIKGIHHPYQIIEMKALMGDTADNIPGCPGVGPKTAVKLINEYETVDCLYDNIDQLKGKLKERLVENKEQVYLSRDLAAIHTDVEFDCPLDSCLYQWNREKLLSKLEELEFKTLVRSFAG